MNAQQAEARSGPVMTIDEAIDEYLHAIVRSRPWIKKREEDLLTPFSEWLFEQPDARLTLDAITPDVAACYVAAAGLAPDERDELFAALHNLYTWAIYAQVIDANPFPPAPAE
jgi:hypothetical protein